MNNALAWLAAALLTLGLGAMASSAYDEAEADRQDTEALSSREWVAAQFACPKGETPEWLDDKTLRCLRELDEPRLVAGERP